jgi:hypothetical protein
MQHKKSKISSSDINKIYYGKCRKNLRDLYEEKYLRGNDVIQEQTNATSDQNTEVLLEAKKKFVKGKKKSPNKVSNDVAGGEYYTDSTNFTDIFGDILKTFNEDFDGGDVGGDMGGSDDTFDYEDSGSDEGEQSFSLSELRGMTLGELADLISGGGEDEYDDMGGGEDFGNDDMGTDDIPLESYGFEGDGQHVGAQANYSGKAGLLPKTDLVTPDGNIKKEKAKVGAKPNKNTGSEGKHHGAQSTRDGKASKQGKSNLVKDNGDADFGKMKTGYGKAKGEDLY